jgi:hypothetical protein
MRGERSVASAVLSYVPGSDGASRRGAAREDSAVANQPSSRSIHGDDSAEEIRSPLSAPESWGLHAHWRPCDAVSKLWSSNAARLLGARLCGISDSSPLQDKIRAAFGPSPAAHVTSGTKWLFRLVSLSCSEASGFRRSVPSLLPCWKRFFEQTWRRGASC